MPADTDVPISPGQLVRMVTDDLARRFVDCGRSDIEEKARACYGRLVDGARVTDHLAVLVEHDVANQLRAERPRPASD